MNTNKIDFNSPQYKRSRSVYMAQCTFEYMLALLVTDAFLAKLLSHLGLDDTTIGIISSFITLAFVIQIFSLFLYKLKMPSKTVTLIFYPLSRLLFSSLYIIPFIPIGTAAVKVVVMCFILLAYASKYIVLNVLYKWANTFVEPTKRASYSATKEIISIAAGIVFTASVGYVFDAMEANGNIKHGFIMIAVLAFIISASDVVCLLFIKREESEKTEHRPKHFKDIIKNTLGNKNFRSVVIFTAIYNSAVYLTNGFLGTFKVNDLMISVFVIQLINIIGNVVRMAASKPFGHFSDKHSFASGMAVALVFLSVGYVALMFTTPKTWLLIAIYTVLYSATLAGVNQNSFNIAYSYVDSDYITEALAIKNFIGGLFGFFASLVGSRILKYVQSNGNTLFGIHVYGQQLLAAISLVLILAALFVMIFVVGKQKAMKQ
ncbi:MAG: MFS transporter [Ruminococcaceae bacterium]|nr:MFS transporter [Oscillospiraceae bacterium]